MPPRFKLYHFPASRSARVKWMLHEVLDDDFEVEIVEAYDGATFEEDYLLKNPNHNVPTLEIRQPDGATTYMLESGAMVAFLADGFPDKGLAPPPSPLSVERADYEQMLYFGASWVDMVLWQVRSHEHLLSDEERDLRTIQRYRAKCTSEIEPQLVARLERQSFICGDRFTAADCIMGHNVLWGRGYGLFRHDALRGYLSRLSKRPAFLEAFSAASRFVAQPPEGSAILERFTG